VFVLSYRTIQRVAAQVELEPWEMVQRPIDLGKAERNDVSPDSPRPWLCDRGRVLRRGSERRGSGDRAPRLPSHAQADRRQWIKTIIVESPDRFARDLAVQLAGHDMLKGLGIDLIPASAPDFFTEDTPTAVLVRQVLGAIAQFEKASLVAKLKAARDRKRARDGK
jgi:Resolvase, N terminal domain